jgi:hypothetical protein
MTAPSSSRASPPCAGGGRGAFERWARREQHLLRRLVDDSRYESLQTESAWEAWSARDAEVATLLEALQRMLDAFYEDPLDADACGAANNAYAAIAKATESA